MAHHNRADCTRWPCNPTSSPWTGHHPEPTTDVDEDDGTTSEARVPVQPPREPRTDDES
jgi:hypothetical protein